MATAVLAVPIDETKHTRGRYVADELVAFIGTNDLTDESPFLVTSPMNDGNHVLNE